MKYFKATQKLPFGIKKDDILTYDGKVLTNSEGKVIPLNPLEEKDFFKQHIIFTGKFPIGSKVMIKEKIIRTNIQIHHPMEVLEYPDKNTVLVSFNGIKHKIKETLLFAYQEYWFLSSNGKPHQTILGRDESGDIYRSKLGNMFNTKEEAQNKLKEILG